MMNLEKWVVGKMYQMSSNLGNLPKFVTVGAYKVELVKIEHAIAYDSSDYQGSFVAKPPLKMFFDEDIIDGGGMDAVNLVLHEFCHLGFYQYHMKDKDEEHVVNSYANFLTEVLMRSELKDWLKWQML